MCVVAAASAGWSPPLRDLSLFPQRCVINERQTCRLGSSPRVVPDHLVVEDARTHVGNRSECARRCRRRVRGAGSAFRGFTTGAVKPRRSRLEYPALREAVRVQVACTGRLRSSQRCRGPQRPNRPDDDSPKITTGFDLRNTRRSKHQGGARSQRHAASALSRHDAGNGCRSRPPDVCGHAARVCTDQMGRTTTLAETKGPDFALGNATRSNDPRSRRRSRDHQVATSSLRQGVPQLRRRGRDLVGTPSACLHGNTSGSPA